MTTITRLLIAGTALSLGLGLMHSQSAFAKYRHPQVLRGFYAQATTRAVVRAHAAPVVATYPAHAIVDDGCDLPSRGRFNKSELRMTRCARCLRRQAPRREAVGAVLSVTMPPGLGHLVIAATRSG